MSKQIAAALAGVGVAVALAACGGSKGPGVQLAPAAGATEASVPTTPPVPPALSKKPVVTVPKGPPPNHLVVKTLVQGTGKPVAQGQLISVNYVGVLYKTGKQFDASWHPNNPFRTGLTKGTVIQGWVQGLTGVRVGSRVELIIPPSLGYGSRRTPVIPPNSTLVFVIDVLAAE